MTAVGRSAGRSTVGVPSLPAIFCEEMNWFGYPLDAPFAAPATGGTSLITCAELQAVVSLLRSADSHPVCVCLR